MSLRQKNDLPKFVQFSLKNPVLLWDQEAEYFFDSLQDERTVLNKNSHVFKIHCLANFVIFSKVSELETFSLEK